MSFESEEIEQLKKDLDKALDKLAYQILLKCEAHTHIKKLEAEIKRQKEFSASAVKREEDARANARKAGEERDEALTRANEAENMLASVLEQNTNRALQILEYKDRTEMAERELEQAREWGRKKHEQLEYLKIHRREDIAHAVAELKQVKAERNALAKFAREFVECFNCPVSCGGMDCLGSILKWAKQEATKRNSGEV